MTVESAGGDFSFRPLTRADLPKLGKWLREPHVAAWWRDPSDLASLEDKYLPVIGGTEPTEVFIVELDRQPIGLVQRYLLDDYPAWGRAVGLSNTGAAGIDYLIGEEALTGHGIGARMIEAFTHLTFRRYPKVHVVTADPQQDNAASCRALERAGFEIAWSGQLDSDDPSDAGPSHVYVKWRPGAPSSSTDRRA